MSNRRYAPTFALLALAAATPAPGRAQYAATAVAGAVRQTAALTPEEQTTIARASVGADVNRLNRAARGALVGAGVGGLVGMSLAFFLTHQPGIIDHSEDGLAYIAFVPSGALLGGIVGAVVGAVQHD